MLLDELPAKKPLSIAEKILPKENIVSLKNVTAKWDPVSKSIYYLTLGHKSVLCINKYVYNIYALAHLILNLVL